MALSICLSHCFTDRIPDSTALGHRQLLLFAAEDNHCLVIIPSLPNGGSRGD